MKKMSVGCLVASLALPLFALDIVKQNNTDPLNAGSSWTNGAAPSAADVGTWNSIVTGANSSALTNAATWDGIKIVNPGGAVAITGTNVLTLDGGAATDINMASATQDLLFGVPVSLGGTSPLIDIASGRTLTFAGALAVPAEFEWNRQGTGTLVFDGAVSSTTSNSLVLFNGTTVLTGKNGNLNFSSTGDRGGRLYVGRNAGSDAVLIISNGVHETKGVSPADRANFVGAAYGRGRLFMEGGSLNTVYLRIGINGGPASGLPSEIVVNNGSLSASGSGTGINGYALMLGTTHDDNSTSACTHSGTLTVNGGVVAVTNGLVKLGSGNSGSAGTQTVNLNGGLFAVRQFYLDTAASVAKVFNFNGGTLQVVAGGTLFGGPGALQTNVYLNVGTNGLAVNVTDANDTAITQPLRAAGPGGLTKSGNGTLTLTGTNTYTGRTRVLAGTLRIGDATTLTHPDLFVASGAGLSLRDGALATFGPKALALGNAISASSLELELAAAGSECDVLALPAGASVGRVAFAPVVQGTTARASRAGDYVVMTYAGAAPDVGGFTVAGPAAGRVYSFILDTEAKTVTLRIAYGTAESIWTATGSGDWETAGNWSALPSNAAGAKARLDSSITAPATVTAAAPVTLGGLTLANTNAYTLAGGGFTFDNGASAPYLTVSQGTHTVSAPLTLAGDLQVKPALNTQVKLGGVVSGPRALVKDDAGELWLTEANTYGGGTRLKLGTVLLSDSAALGTGTVTAEGGSGFRIVGATPVTLTNTLVVTAGMSINALNSHMTLNGTMDWQAAQVVTKSGANELRLGGTASETTGARLAVETGTLRFLSGSDYNLACGSRDTIQMQRDISVARQVIVDAGAQVNVDGIYMEYGLSNTVVVQGGKLTLRGGLYNSNLEACLMRANGTGTDRFIVESGEVIGAPAAFFSIGIRGGANASAALVINGGTTTLGRVSLGVRWDSGTFDGRGRLDVNGGRLNVTEGFNWMGDTAPGRTNIVVLGNGTPGSGVLRLPATANTCFTANNQPLLTFNGGTLETAGLAPFGSSTLTNYLYGAKQVYVGAGGAVIDTLGNSLAITQPLQSGAAADGGLTKRGNGTLTLTGAGGFQGLTAVEQGALCLPAVYASTGVVVAAAAELSLANGSIQTQAFSVVILPSGAKVTFEALANGSACDRIALPADATLGDLSIAVVQSGTSVPASRPGDYILFTFPGGAPTVSGWTLRNPPAGRTWSFEVVGSTVVLRIAAAAGISVWTNSGSGAWETAGNWSVAPADADGTVVRLDDAVSAPATVTRAAGSTVGSLTFNNAKPYTLAGAALTLANTGGVPAVVASEFGVHTLTAALNLTSNATLRAAAGAAVALNGGVSGSTTLTVEGPGALALPDTAGLAIDGLALSGAGILVVSNSATLTTPVALGTGGGVFAPVAGQALAVASAVTGSGSLTKESSSFLMLTNANASYAGATSVKAGTLRLDTLPDGGFEFGQGTLHFVGAADTTASGYTLKTDAAARAGVLRADGDVTFQGSVTALSGALVKTGPGTVAFTAAGENVFNADNGAGASHAVLDIGVNGDSPTTGFSGFNIVEGKVVVGAPGQTNRFNGLLVVGLNSTTNTNAETAGTLEIVDGLTTVSDSLLIGRSNGFTNTAPVARVSKLRLAGGELSVGSLILGRALVAAGHNSAPEAEITGGLLTATNVVSVGEQSGSVATLKLNGGTLVAPSIARVNGQGHVLFNGGVFRPSAEGQALQGLTSAKVGTSGAKFDLSQVNMYTLAQTLTTDGADGGLVKSGAGMLVVSGKQLYAGPTLIPAGSLRIPMAGSLSNATALTVSPGAALVLDTANTQIVSLAALTLGAASSAPVSLTMAFLTDGTANDRLTVSGTVTLGTVALTLVRVGLNDAFGLNGTYTLMTYTGADPSVAGLGVANPLYGKTYSFAASSGSVTMTVETDYTGANGGAVWNVAGGGSWFDSGNWTVAPGAGGIGQQVRFDDKISAPATVTLDSAATVGAVYFKNTNAYTLAGTATLTLDNGAGTQSVVSVEAGSHAVAAPVAVQDAGVVVQAPTGTGLTLGGAVSGTGALVKAGGGELTVSQPSTRTGGTQIQSGTLTLRNGGHVGSGELTLNGAYSMRVTGTAPATLSNPVTLKSAAANTPIIRAEEQALTLSGTLDWQTGIATVYKYGTNELVLAGTGGSAGGTPKLFVREGGLRFASGANYALTGSTRESVKLGLAANMKTALTVEEGATVKIGGILASAEATSTTNNDVLVTQNGGSLELRNTSGDGGDALFLRDYGTAPATYVMNGGTFTMPQAAWANVGNYGPGRLTVNGGSMTLGRFAAGYQMNSNATAGGSAEVTVNGGRLEATGSWSWMSDSNARQTDVRVNGGTLALPATRTYGTNVSRWTGLTLNGGTLETLGAALDSAATDDYLAGVRRVALGAGGGTFNTLDKNVTVRQNVLALSNTGGVAKVGSGTLTLAGTNVLWGLTDVQEGTLRARLTHRDLPGTPVFRFGMDSTGNPDLSGNGIPLTAGGSGFTATNRNATSQALTFNGTGYFTSPHNAYYANMTNFTVSTWILLTANVITTAETILSTRPGANRALDLKLNTGNVLRLLQHSYDTQTWWQEFRTTNALPVGQWTHVAAVLTPQGVAMYVNGVRQPLKQHYNASGVDSRDYVSGYYYLGDFRFASAGQTGGFVIGRPTTGTSPSFKGAMDDFMLFDRALSDADVAQLYSESPVQPASVRVAALGTLDLMGSSNVVSEATGCGQVINGTLAVQGRLAVGDTAAQAPGALLTVANLTLGTNMVYACSFNGVVNDLAQVPGLLQVNGAGVIDFGRTEANPLSGSFSLTVMTYGSVTGGSNFTGWSVTGLGRRGYATSVKALNGEVIVTLKSTFGTVLQLK